MRGLLLLLSPARRGDRIRLGIRGVRGYRRILLRVSAQFVVFCNIFLGAVLTRFFVIFSQIFTIVFNIG
jgi:hypothetical protein